METKNVKKGGILAGILGVIYVILSVLNPTKKF